MRIGEEPSRALLDSAILRVGAASPWPRTVCESAGERWHNGAGSLPDLGYPVTPMLVCMLAWAVDGGFRPSITGVGGACASRRTVWESSRERWRDGAGVYRTSGFRPPSVVALTLAWACDATDFRRRSHFAAVGRRPIRVKRRMALDRASRTPSAIYPGDSGTLLRAAAQRLRGPGSSEYRASAAGSARIAMRRKHREIRAAAATRRRFLRAFRVPGVRRSEG